jgi:transposase
MPKPRPPYPPEFRRRRVELVRAGRSPEELAREFEPSARAIRTWVQQADRDDGRRDGDDGLTSTERDELRRLRREVRQLRQEREILAKAAAVDQGPLPRSTARETGSIPSGSSSS